MLIFLILTFHHYYFLFFIKVINLYINITLQLVYYSHKWVPIRYNISIRLSTIHYSCYTWPFLYHSSTLFILIISSIIIIIIWACHYKNRPFNNIIVRKQSQIVRTICAIILVVLVYYQLMGTTYNKIWICVKCILLNP